MQAHSRFRQWRRQRRRQAGGAIAIVLVVLLLLVGALGANYVRNVEREAQEDQATRPYARLSDSDLDLMLAGYREEIARASEHAGSQRVEARERFHLGDQVQEFERVQRATRAVRDRNIAVAELKAQLARLEAEIAHRQDTGAAALVHLRRMFRL